MSLADPGRGPAELRGLFVAGARVTFKLELRETRGPLRGEKYGRHPVVEGVGLIHMYTYICEWRKTSRGGGDFCVGPTITYIIEYIDFDVGPTLYKCHTNVLRDK